VILDGTLLRIDRVAMASGRDRPYYFGKHKAHGVNVQVIADPAGRLIWASPALPGARHDMGAATEQGRVQLLGSIHPGRVRGSRRNIGCRRRGREGNRGLRVQQSEPSPTELGIFQEARLVQGP
jgi:DDE superfamily endonuclease